MAKKKTKEQLSKQEQDERDTHNFNQGRLSADLKWIECIHNRIKDLEQSVGIPELRRLIKHTKYKWK